MSQIKHGGPAFPNNEIWITDGKGNSQPDPSCAGMSLRDYFAAKAMQGLLAASGDGNTNVEYDVDAVVRSAFAMADAMLEARKS